jgi:hypothetical protein
MDLFLSKHQTNNKILVEIQSKNEKEAKIMGSNF